MDTNDLYEEHDIAEHQRQAFDAFVEGGYAPEDFNEAYSGEYDSERDFAETLAEELGLLDSEVSWPFTCIDWEHATRELMYDYWSARTPDHGVWIYRNV